MSLALASGLAFFGASAAHAQAPLPTAPPVYSTVDENGVDLITGTFNYSVEEVSIGQPGEGGLAYVRTFLGPGWRDNYIGTLNVSGSVYTVSLGAGSETFTLSSGTYTSDQANGSTLTYNSGTGVYTYTLRDGAVALFSAALANGGMVYNANVARIITLTRPSGEQITFNYKSVSPQSVAGMRLQSVVNNFGYQLHFEYSLNNPTLSSQLPAWRTLTKVVGINMAVDYCDPNSDTCSGFSTTWPSATYAISGSYETVTDSLNQTTRYTFYAGGMRAIRRPSGTTNDNIYINYDGSNRVDIVGNGTGNWYYSYSTVGSTRTTTRTDPLSHTRVVVSDTTTQRATSDTNGVGQTTSFLYDGNRRLTRITQPELNYVEYTYDSRGNITQTTQYPKSGGGSISMSASYTATGSCTSAATCNQPNSTTDALGNQTDYTYDSTHGGLLTMTLPAPSGGGIRPQTRFGYTSLYAYYKNSGGSIVQGPSPVYRLTTVSSCAAGTAPSCLATADEMRTTTTYGSTGVANNLLPTVVATGPGNGNSSNTPTTTTAYDAVGNVYTVDGPLSGSGDTTRYRFDADRQLTGVVGPDPDGGGSLENRALRITYNVDGQQTLIEQGTVNSQSDPDWSTFAALMQTGMTYDFIGRLTSRTLAAGGTTHGLTQFTYDNANRLECSVVRMNSSLFATPPSSACTLGVAGSFGPDRITRFSYDNADRQTQFTLGDGAPTETDEWTATYSNNGQVATIADGNGNLITYEYDLYDRLVKIRFPNTSGGGSSTTDFEQFTLNAASNITVDQRRDGTTRTYAFDFLNRITSMTPSSNGQTVSYTYDNFSRMLTAGYTGQTITLAYDPANLRTTENGPHGTTTNQFDLAGRRTRLTWPDTLYVDYDYDLTNALTAVRENGASSGAGVLITYSYNDMGLRTSATRGNGAVETLTYDSAWRLNTLTHNLSGSSYDQTITLSYNPAGQIVSRIGSNTAYQWTPISPATTSYSPNGLNQYSSVGGTSYSYDGRGNRASPGSLGYDINNSLTSGAGSASLVYDPLHRLYETSSSGTVAVRFLLNGNDVVGEYNTGGTLQRRYIPGLEAPIAWYEGSGTSDRRWLIPDQLGSVIAITDGSAVATAINKYDEYGHWGSNTGRFQFAGQPILPEVALYHFGARAYSPALGRFLQSDPILFDGGMNLYAYASNDPVNRIDPSGLRDRPPTATTVVRIEGGESEEIVVRGAPITSRPVPMPPGFVSTAVIRGYGDSTGGGGADFVDIAADTCPASEPLRRYLSAAQELAGALNTLSLLTGANREAGGAIGATSSGALVSGPVRISPIAGSTNLPAARASLELTGIRAVYDMHTHVDPGVNNALYGFSSYDVETTANTSAYFRGSFMVMRNQVQFLSRATAVDRVESDNNYGPFVGTICPL